MTAKPSLGTQLRHLIELLDGAVDRAYCDAGLDYRSRYTPVVRALIEHEPLTIGQIAQEAGITQPAATQTVALMIKEGLLVAEAAAEDGRQRLINLTPAAHAMLPTLRTFWRATAAAADSIDAELPVSLQLTVQQAIEALKHKSFDQRISEARRRTKSGAK